MPFDRNDLTREAGYSEGDVLPLETIVNPGSNGDSTTSSSFVDTFSALQLAWDPDSLLAADQTTLKTRLTVLTETVDGTLHVRARDTTNGRTIGQEIVTTGAFDPVGQDQWYDYTPPTAPIKIRGQIRNEDGASTVAIRNVRLQFGIEL